MSYDFNADEIFEMAQQIERNGAEFYRTAAREISDSAHKTLLLDLAAMEDEHEKTFATLRAELSDKEREPTVFDPDSESAQYLKALADTQVFFKKKVDISSLKEIFKEALTAEKDSIVFYLGMRELVPERLGKSTIDEIIKEEMGHIKSLGHKLAALKD